ncbi:MAG: class I SAM-dependent methyltransferase [bacterium]|nr:class I SAM-dependent methyltransferase [bacterium]
MDLDSNSLERLVPDRTMGGDVTGRETLELHLERYRFAAHVAGPGRLLDMACGAGYGTRLLADACPERAESIGVDLSEDAIAYARERYGRTGVDYQACDATRFSDAEGFDTIVSLETIEHLPDPTGFSKHLLTLLRPGGLLVASVPTTPSVDANPHHLHDFTEKSFRSLFEPAGLKEVARLPQVQPFELGGILKRSEVRHSEIRPHLLRYYATHPSAALRRIYATLRFGFTNRYLTIAWRAP